MQSKVKVKVDILAIALLTWVRLVSRNAFTILEVAADWQVHYAAIYCPHKQTIGPAVQHTDIPLPQSATLSFHAVARKLLLVSRPAEGRRLSGTEHTVG